MNDRTQRTGRALASATKLHWLGAAAIVAVGVAIRGAAARSDLWLDEIWSLALVRGAGSALDVLRIAHDNSHPLNSLYLWMLGDGAPAPCYRLLALASGIATIVLALRIGRTKGPMGSLVAGTMVALSFPLVIYSSEARGYMIAVAAAFGAFLLARRLLAAPRWPARLGFWLTCVVGLLAHYAFLQVLVALGLWSTAALWRSTRDRRRALAELFRMHVVPLAALAMLYVTTLARVRLGGGPKLPLDSIVGQTVGWALGLPFSWTGIAVSLAVLALALELWSMRREGDDAWIFFLALVVVVPVLVMALRPPLLYPRYFLPSVAFLVLILASLITRLLRRGGIASLAGVVLLVVFCSVNTTRIAWFLRDTRGSYRSALVWMASESPRSRATITGSNDFALRHEISFHGRALPAGKRVDYVPLRRVPRGGADWLIVRREQRAPEPDATVQDQHGNDYVLRARFPFYARTGAEWFVYARAR